MNKYKKKIKKIIYRLSHISSIDLSNNLLKHIYELSNLNTLVSLNLSHNMIVSLLSESQTSNAANQFVNTQVFMIF